MPPEPNGSAVGPGRQASDSDLRALDWDKQAGLLPAVVQDADTLRVLMVGYMDPDALQTTLDTGLVTFHSRSRDTQWVKGESSGNTLALVRVEVDCDRDTLLVLARPAGPTCHTGSVSCFGDAPGEFLAELDALVADRERNRPEGSYTTALFASGPRGIAQKVGEEGVEAALAGAVEDEEALAGEAADLLYHLVVLLRARGMSLHEAVDVLRARHRPDSVDSARG